jgi:hypothetical protein
MFEQLAARVDMSPGQRALAIDLMLAFARAEIMTPAFFPKGHGEANWYAYWKRMGRCWAVWSLHRMVDDS